MLQTDPILVNFLDKPLFLAMLALLSLWALVWKGIALWKSSRHNQRNWFIALLILNTFGILEIVYLFYFQAGDIKKPSEE